MRDVFVNATPPTALHPKILLKSPSQTLDRTVSLEQNLTHSITSPE